MFIPNILSLLINYWNLKKKLIFYIPVAFNSELLVHVFEADETLHPP